MSSRLKLLLAIAATLLGLAGHADAASALSIRVEGDGWGSANRHDIEAALYSVAATLTPLATAHPDSAIVVTHNSGAPVVLYDRGAAGEYRVLLHASGAEWHLYVYEFAHEFCHILSNYAAQASDVPRRNQWFEESLCETASLFALRTLAEGWQAAPPTPQLAGGSRQLRWFFELLMAEEHRRAHNAGFATWLKTSEDELRLDPYQRRKNETVATRLLPLFSAQRSSWAALSYLNLDPADNDCSFDIYLDHWYRNARAEQKTLVAEVRALLLENAPLP